MLSQVGLIVALAAFLITSNVYGDNTNGERTPETESAKYLKKIFLHYGVDIESGGEMGEEKLTKLMWNLGLGVIHKIPSNGNEHQVDEGHDKRKKRDTDQLELPRMFEIGIYSDVVSSVPHEHENINNSETNYTTDCRSAPLLLREFALGDVVTSDSGISPTILSLLCPAIIHLVDEKTCVEVIPEVEKEKPRPILIWGYGILSVTIISLLSFLGVVLIPLISATFFQTMLSVLVAGAVGALTGDALLHLLPHSQSSSHSHNKEPVFKSLIVLAGIYILFVIEGIMKLSHHKNDRKSKKKMNRKDANDEDVKSRVSMTKSDSDDEEGGHHELDVAVHDNKPHDHGRHGHEHTHDHGDIQDKTIASVAWMVIAGDGMHNFSDGVAIGAAFTASLVGGMSTSLAVFCHELPHELGDFAMLVKSGMSVKQALIYNGVAACIGYLGLVIGILIGNYASHVTPWIFAVTAGMFLYVALVDMLPEISSGLQDMKTSEATNMFILQNIGLLVGVGIMLLIALFEENFELG